MARLTGAAAALLLMLSLAACGATEEEKAARVLESSVHELAAGDTQAACEAFSTEARREWLKETGGDYCAWLRESASKMTPNRKRQYAAAKAVRVKVRGDRATGYLRFGDCIVSRSDTRLIRDDSGDWRIEDLGGGTTGREKRCLDR
jgi:hypothetical protein